MSFDVRRPAPRRRRSSDPFGYVVAAVLGGLVVFAAFALGAASGDPEPDPVASTIAVVADATSTTTTTTTGVPTTTSTTTRPPASVPLTMVGGSVADVAALVAPAVVQIETIDSVGSGVIWRPDGHIITAAHVLRDPTAEVTTVAHHPRRRGADP